MKKLYENIEDVNIKGGISQLSEVVTAMDISLQNIADSTDRLTGILGKYSSANKGTQYEKVVNTSMELRDVLFQASFELNDMQNQIVVYQNKLYRYEDMNESAQKPNPYLVEKHQVSVDTTAVQFNKSDMLNVSSALKNYSQSVMYHLKTIMDKKNMIAGVWRDSQYKDFAEFVDGVARTIVDAVKKFEEYYLYLEEKIKELS